MKFAQKLYKLRTDAGYSQEDLANKLEVSRQAVSKWEMGVALPETNKLVDIARFFGVSIDYLLKEGLQLDPDEGLDRLVLKFLGYAQDMDGASKELIDILKDGVIDDDEKEQMKRILETLDTVAEVIREIKMKLGAE